MDTNEKERIYQSCTRFLPYHYPQNPQQVLAELAASTDPAIAADIYGRGKLINDFEQEVADLLAKEAAVFMPSGTMCQQIALRIWCEREGTATVAFHPTCHLEMHEQRGYQRLHRLQGILLGSPDRMFTLDDLKAVPEPLGALLIELPQREIGGQLPTWEQLVEMIAWAREHGIPTHLDGARLWECRPFYQRPYHEIASFFDTVYVSFYKILGGIAGSILAGPTDVIAEARAWQRRHGGNLFHLYPYVLSAQKGLRDRIGRMETYHHKAIEVAELLATFPQIEVVPNPPHTNMMHVYIRGDAQKMQQAALAVAQESGTWLSSWFAPTAIPTYCKFELTVGDATLDLSSNDITQLFQTLLEKAESV